MCPSLANEGCVKAVRLMTESMHAHHMLAHRPAIDGWMLQTTSVSHRHADRHTEGKDGSHVCMYVCVYVTPPTQLKNAPRPLSNSSSIRTSIHESNSSSNSYAHLKKRWSIHPSIHRFALIPSSIICLACRPRVCVCTGDSIECLVGRLARSIQFGVHQTMDLAEEVDIAGLP